MPLAFLDADGLFCLRQIGFDADRLAISEDLAYAIGSYELSLDDAAGRTAADKRELIDGFRKG